MESLFNNFAGLKAVTMLCYVFSSQYLEIFENSFFYRRPSLAASCLYQKIIYYRAVFHYKGLHDSCFLENFPEKFPGKQFLKHRSSPSEVFLGKGVLKICYKFTIELSCRSVISIKLQKNFIEITFRHRCSPVNLLHIFRKPFYKKTFEGCF